METQFNNPPPYLDTSSYPAFVPLLTIERYADSVGVTPHVVEAWIKRGYIPTHKVGRRRLVNIIAIIQELNKVK